MYRRFFHLLITVALLGGISFFIFTPVANAQENNMIIINKKTNQLGFYQNGVLVKVFPVATGLHRNFTPEGQFRVINKIVNPPYYKKRIPGGSPSNPLGPRWLGLSCAGGAYGIHGNSNANSIGTYASEGCIRLYNQDILWLYDQVSVGTPVTIVWNDTNLKVAFIDNTPIKVYVNEEVMTLENQYKTFTKENSPYIPLKIFSQLLNCTIFWNDQTNSIELQSPDFTAELRPNEQNASFNGQIISLTEPPLIFEGTTYLTKSTIEELFHVQVDWLPKSRELHLTMNISPQSVNFEPSPASTASIMQSTTKISEKSVSP
ncbi:L,D-transpeptidase family protein [Desulforamulus aeronauticus]|uniref:Copper amine oxidase N-terminal domain-containing protein n=1 Tax=Desulforamulus aeronauticus DSM 10349 TaxID=1121421 RepID=A0A1M6SMU5_9FIRM|nr:L,D-transpeptidase family protein [Desulforamulus aeronauticus]SHK45929.1 Copper amine oxidase N-terminal domain-containing protein [Desulforamulus aeronauticus DSM 10349]